MEHVWTRIQTRRNLTLVIAIPCGKDICAMSLNASKYLKMFHINEQSFSEILFWSIQPQALCGEQLVDLRIDYQKSNEKP